MADSNKNRGDSPKKQGDKMNQNLRDQTMGGISGRGEAEDLDTEAFTEGQDRNLEAGDDAMGRGGQDRRMKSLPDQGKPGSGKRGRQGEHGREGWEQDQGRGNEDIERGRSSGMTGSDSQRAQRRGGNRGSGVTGGQRSNQGRAGRS